MGKRAGLLYTGLVAAMGGIGWLKGNSIYRQLFLPRQDEEGEDNCKLPEKKWIRDGRAWLLSQAERKDIYTDSIDHLKLHAFLLSPPEEEGHDVAVVVHAEHSCAEETGIYARHYLEEGYQVLMPDLRGHGRSEGNYIAFGYDDRLDVMDWIYWIIKRDPKARIVLHGLSSGGAACLLAEGEHLPSNVIAVISDSSYTSLKEECARLIRLATRSDFLPTALRLFFFRVVVLFRAGFDLYKASPIHAVKHATVPTLFLHGDNDQIVPVEMCKRLYREAVCSREYATFIGAGHLEGVMTNPNRYWKRVDSFIARQKET